MAVRFLAWRPRDREQRRIRLLIEDADGQRGSFLLAYDEAERLQDLLAKRMAAMDQQRRRHRPAEGRAGVTNDYQQRHQADGQQVPAGLDFFDFQMATARDNPESTSTKPATLRSVVPLIGAVQTFTVQTFRIPERGDWGFVECTSAQGFVRVVLPPAVMLALARQRDQLTTTGRVKRGKAAASARKDAGLPNPLTDPKVQAKARAARLAKARSRKAKRKGKAS